jgi:hypothetical protein
MAPIILGGLVKAAEKLIDHWFPDPNIAADKKLELAKLEQTGELARLASDTSLAQAQIAVNAEEAKSTNWFVSGWRPAVGWIGAFSLGYAAILEPLIRFTATVIFKYQGTFPILDSNITMQILFGILGLGAYRTVEKVKKNGG